MAPASLALSNGRTVLGRAKRRRLLDTLTTLGTLPPETLRLIFSYLPKRSLLELKYGQGKIREVASSLVHARLRIPREQKSLQGLIPVLAGIGFHVRDVRIEHLSHDPLPPNFFTARTFPHLQTVSITQSSRAALFLTEILEQLAVLPFLSGLQLHFSNALSGAAIFPSKKRNENSTGSAATEAEMFFPSLVSLKLRAVHKSVCKYLLNKYRPLYALKRLSITGCYISPRSRKSFPAKLETLRLVSCPTVGWGTILRLIEKSKDTLETLCVSCGPKIPRLDFASSTRVVLPRLKVLALDDIPPGWEYSLEEYTGLKAGEGHCVEPVDIPAWTRSAIGCHSRIEAPALETSALGYLLMEAPLEAIQDLVRSRSDGQLKHYLASHFEPPRAGYSDTTWQAHLRATFHALHARLAGGKAKLLGLGEEQYDAFMEEKLGWITSR